MTPAPDPRPTPLELVQGDHTETERQAWIASASIDEIIELLRLLSRHSHLATRARQELDRRIKEARGHAGPKLATMTPVYVMAFAALVLAVVSAWPVFRVWMGDHPGELQAAPPRGAADATNSFSAVQP